MRYDIPWLVGLFLGLAPLFFQNSATAGSLSVAPTRVELDRVKGMGSVQLTNAGTEDTLIQVESFIWTESSAIEGLTPTRELLAVPAVFGLAPGQSQIIRVAARPAQASNIEQAYRLLITEVPRPDQVRQGGVLFAMRFNVPVFLTPAGAIADPTWSIRSGPQNIDLQIDNVGSAHLRIARLRLQTEDGAAHEISGPIYVQPGKAQLVPLPEALRGKRLTIEADTNIGELTVDLTA